MYVYFFRDKKIGNNGRIGRVGNKETAIEWKKGGRNQINICMVRAS